MASESHEHQPKTCPDSPPSTNLEQFLPLEAMLLEKTVQSVEGVWSNVDLLFTVPRATQDDEHRTVVRDEINLQSNVRVSVSCTEDKLPDLRQLVQASSRAGPDLTPERFRPLLLEALVLDELVDLHGVVSPKVQAFLLLAMFVEEYKVWVVVGNEIYLESSVSVSMARLLDEAADFRQLIQTSSRAGLDLSCPCSLHYAWTACRSAALLQPLREELKQVVALPATHICSHYSTGILLLLELDRRLGTLLVFNLQRREERRLPLNEVVQILILVLRTRIGNEPCD